MTLALLTPLPPGASSRTRLARHGDRLVVLRELLEGMECVRPAPAARLVTLEEVVELEGRRHALYEWVPGATLREALAAFDALGRVAPLGLVGRVLIDAARALAGARPARPHGGLSDAALQLGLDGAVSVLDWGGPRPSRFRPPGRASAAGDVFALGAILHGALTRYEGAYAPPPALAPPSTCHEEATPAIDALVLRALSPRPEARQASVSVFAGELEAALGDELLGAEQLGQVVRTLFKDRIRLFESLEVLPGAEAQRTEPARPVVRAPSSHPGRQRGRGAAGGRPLKPWDSAVDLEGPVSPEERTVPGAFPPAVRQSPAEPTGRRTDPAAGAPPPPRPVRPRAPAPGPSTPPHFDLSGLGERTNPGAPAPTVPWDTQPVRSPDAPPAERPRLEVVGAEYAGLDEPTGVRARVPAALEGDITTAQTARRLPAIAADAPAPPRATRGLWMAMLVLLVVVAGLAVAVFFKVRAAPSAVAPASPLGDPDATAGVDAALAEPALDSGETLPAGVAEAGGDAGEAGGEAPDGGAGDGGADEAGQADAGVLDGGGPQDAGAPRKAPARKPAKKPVKKAVKKKRRR